jgi:hypothetical protein
MPADPRAIVIRLPQPVPLVTFVSRLNGVTAIGRRWEPGDTRRCRLCPDCTAEHDLDGCLITTEDEVATDEANLYSFDSWGDEPSDAGGGRRTAEPPDLRLAVVAAGI